MPPLVPVYLASLSMTPETALHVPRQVPCTRPGAHARYLTGWRLAAAHDFAPGGNLRCPRSRTAPTATHLTRSPPPSDKPFRLSDGLSQEQVRLTWSDPTTTLPALTTVLYLCAPLSPAQPRYVVSSVGPFARLLYRTVDSATPVLCH